MPHHLKVAALETEHLFGQTERALGVVDLALANEPHADLVLLCEAGLTGYVSPQGNFDLAPFAEPLKGPTCSRICDLAKKHNSTLVAPLIEIDEKSGNYYNSFVACSPQGAILAHYRKRHPWLPETWATPGESAPPLFEINGFAITIAICFDVHFVRADMHNELAKAEVLLFPTAWVNGDGPNDTREKVLPSIAKDYQLWIINANWAPSTPRLWGQGNSQIIDPNGNRVAVAPRGRKTTLVTHTLGHVK